MNIRVIDFGILTKHYVKYREGSTKIEQRKSEFMISLEPLKKELNELIKNNSKNTEVLEKIQNQAIDMDRNFKHEIKNMSDELNDSVFGDLKKIIGDWSIVNNIDLVTGNMEVIFNNYSLDATDDILGILRESGLYID